VLLGCLSHI